MEVIHDRERSVDLEEFLARPLFAHLATASEYGPRESPVWFLWEEGAVWIIGSRASDTFPARIELDARCAVGIVDFDRVSGLVQHVGMRGRATVEPFDADRARRLLRRYLGSHEQTWDQRFTATVTRPAAEQAVLLRFVPERVVARDVSYEPGTPD
jgi:pyridoxamine 5'-phosphate oxidase-like protein